MESSIENLRDKIDVIDDKILKLLSNRLEIVEKISKIKIEKKDSIFVPKREKEIIQRLLHIKKENLSCGFIKTIWKEIMMYSKKVESGKIKEKRG